MINTRSFFRLLAIIILMMIIKVDPLSAQQLEYMNSTLWTSIQDIDISGEFAFCAFHNGPVFIDITDPANPEYVSRFDMLGNARRIVANETEAYVINYPNSLEIYDVSNISEPAHIGTFDDDYWATGALFVDGHYCFLGGGYGDFGSGLIVLDISNPAEPIFLSSCDLNGNAQDIVIRGEYAYVGGGAGLNIVNISNPVDPYVTGQIGFAHGIYDIEIDESYAYLTARSTFGSRFYIVDISDSENPNLLAEYEGRNWETFLNIYVYGNYAYLGTSPSGIFIMDISDRTDPVLIDILGENWLSPFVFGEDNSILACDPNSGFQVVDITDPYNPVIEGDYQIRDYVLSLDYSGEYLYIANWGSGLAVIDVADPSSPEFISSFDNNGRNADIVVVDDYAYIADVDSGLVIVDISDPENPLFVGAENSLTDAYIVEVYGNHAFLIPRWGNDLFIIDISDPANPSFTGIYDSDGGLVSVAVDGDYAYALNTLHGLMVIDISDRSAPFYAGGYNPDGVHFSDIEIKDNFSYLTANRGIYIVDISDPVNPNLFNSLDFPTFGQSIYIEGEYAFVTTMLDGVYVIDISLPEDPQIIASHGTPGNPIDVVVNDNIVYIADGNSIMVLLFDPETGTMEELDRIPSQFALAPNFPNPFNPSTTIRYSLPESGEVSLSIYNILGQRVEILFEGFQQAGEHAVTWDASDYPSGVFFTRLETADRSSHIKMVLLK